MLTEEAVAPVAVPKRKNGVTMLSIDSIKPFHDHPFHLYEGDRLDDMIQSMPKGAGGENWIHKSHI